MKKVWLALLALGLAGFGVTAACNRGPKLTGLACKQDSDCGKPASAWRCETQTGVCYCRNDQACPSTQFCNAVGFCQDRAGCQTTQDCQDPSLFCDTTTGSCLPYGRCNIDLQCPLGQVCDTASSQCVEGCRSNGDCAGVSCRCGDGGCVCTGQTQADRQSCTVGVCDPYFCSDNSFCQYGQQCGVISDSGIPYSQCFSDYDPNHRPYCANCTFGGGTNTCGVGPNYCLIDPTHPGLFYCGSDCASGQVCPRGYACQDVIVVGLPGTTQCPPGGWMPGQPVCPSNNALPCNTWDAGCRFGGTCTTPPGKDAGFCAGQCDIGEGQQFGFCTCMGDQDCPQEACGSNHECSISRRPCLSAADCHFIHCVDFQGAGGCWIGENCAPADGLTCLEVQP